MKKILKLSLKLLLFLVIIYSCTKNDFDGIIENNKSLILRFEISNENNKYSKSRKDSSDIKIIEVNAEITSYSPVKLKSEFLKEVTAINKETGKETYGYILIKNDKKNKDNKSKKAKKKTLEPPPPPYVPDGPPDATWEIRRGYFLYGRCFVYGTMYIGDNGVNLFSPCGINCIALDPICPGENEAFVYNRPSKL